MNRVEYDDVCEVTNVKTGVTVTGEILNFRIKDHIVLTINRSVKLHMNWDEVVNLYIGRMAGMEFQSKGPKIHTYRTVR